MDSKTFLVVTTLLAFSGLASAQCQEGWVEINDGCYGFIEAAAMNWTAAIDYCGALGGELASVKSASTFRGVYEYIIQYGLTGNFWLAASDELVEGDFLWLDGSRVKRGSPYWALDSGVLGYSQEPLGGSEQNCVGMSEERFYYWDDMDCSQLNQILCMQ